MSTKTAGEMAAYIRDTYEISFNGTEWIFFVRSFTTKKMCPHFMSSDLDRVVSYARSNHAHFNYEAEARAFDQLVKEAERQDHAMALEFARSFASRRCGHSACSQNFIDTGETQCVESENDWERHLALKERTS